MDYNELDDMEKEMVDKIRGLKKKEKEALKASEDAFFNWIKTEIPKIWKQISSYAKDVWNWFKGLF